MNSRALTRCLLLLAALLLAVSIGLSLPPHTAAALTPEEVTALRTELETRITDAQKEVRRVAMWALGSFVDAKELKEFSKRFIAHEDPTTKQAALVVLVRRGDKAATTELEKLINATEPKALDALFAEVLWPLGPTARRPMLDKLIKKPASPELRAALVRYLLKAGEGTELDLLSEAIKAKEAPARLLVIDEFLKQPSPALDPLLSALMAAKEPDLRLKTLDLARLLNTTEAQARLAAALSDPDEAIKKKAEALLLELKHPAVIPVLVERIKTDPKDAATLATLVALNPEGVSAALLPALEGENLPLEQPVYNAGMAAIARDKTPEGRALIEKKLGSLFEKDRVAATYAIGFTADRAFNPTLEKLLSDGSMSIRRQAALALAEMRDPSLLPVLTKAYAANQDVDLRVNLILAMQNTGDPAAIKQLQLQLMGGDAKIRRAAIDAVIGLKSPDGVKALTLVAADPDPALRWHIAKGIYLLDPAANDAGLKKAMLDAPEEGFLETLKDLTPEKRQELYESIVRSERATLALQIVEQAAKTRTPNDLALIRLAFDESPKDKVQQAAIQALSVSPLAPPDLGRFKKLVDHKDRAQRLFALQTLLRFDPGSADDVFLTATKDADPFIQVLGIYGLAPR
jgi:HEAT repeat protein